VREALLWPVPRVSPSAPPSGPALQMVSCPPPPLSASACLQESSFLHVEGAQGGTIWHTVPGRVMPVVRLGRGPTRAAPFGMQRALQSASCCP